MGFTDGHGRTTEDRLPRDVSKIQSMYCTINYSQIQIAEQNITQSSLDGDLKKKKEKERKEKEKKMIKIHTWCYIR